MLCLFLLFVVFFRFFRFFRGVSVSRIAFFLVQFDDFFFDLVFLCFVGAVFGFFFLFVLILFDFGIVSESEAVAGFHFLEFRAADERVGFGAVLGFLMLGFHKAGKGSDLVVAQLAFAASPGFVGSPGLFAGFL